MHRRRIGDAARSSDPICSQRAWSGRAPSSRAPLCPCLCGPSFAAFKWSPAAQAKIPTSASKGLAASPP
eukprot:9484431-Pyramimonas_sp.AAC.1